MYEIEKGACIVCGGDLITIGHTDTGYLLQQCVKCKRIYNEE